MSESMTPEKTEKLRAFAKAKRGVLLKDVGVADLLIGADYVEIELGKTYPPITCLDIIDLAYLKLASPEQIDALAKRINSVIAFLPAESWQIPSREVRAFRRDHLKEILSLVVTVPHKYIGSRIPRRIIVNGVWIPGF